MNALKDRWMANATAERGSALPTWQQNGIIRGAEGQDVTMEILNTAGKAIPFQWSDDATLAQEAWDQLVEHETATNSDEMDMLDEDMRDVLSSYDRHN